MSYQAKTQRIRLFSILFVFAFFTAQCGSGETTNIIDDTPTELLWATFDQNSAMETALIEKFRSEHPNITFKRQENRFGPDPLEQTPRPDIMNIGIGHDFDQAIAAGKLADLSELWNILELQDKVPPAIQQIVSVDGKQYMIPTAFNWAAIYYNKAIFAQYNLQPPQTWDQLLELCNTLLINNEVPFAIAGTNGYTAYLWFDYLNLRLNGAQYHGDLLAGKENYEDARISNVLEHWKTLFEQNCFVENPATLNDLGTLNTVVRSDGGKLGRSKTVMVLMDAFNMTQFPAKFRSELGFFRFPIIDPAIPVAEAIIPTGYAIPVDAAHTSQALGFLEYVNSAEVQSAVSQQNLFNGATFAPARTDLAQDQLSDDLRNAIKLIADAQAVAPISPWWMPREMWSGYDLGYRKLLAKERDIVAYQQKLEEARQKAIEKGVFASEE